MKKSLLAVAVAAALPAAAFAQTNVQLYGIADAGIAVIDRGSNLSNSFRVESGMQSTSRWGIRGTEDLGGGLNAVFNLENGYSIDTGASDASSAGLFQRRAVVGLSGGFGTVLLGRDYTAGFTAWGVTDIMGYGLFGNQLTYTASAGGITTRGQNGIYYTSPVFGGLTVRAFYQTGERETDPKSLGNGMGASVVYMGGPLRLQGFYQQFKVSDGTPTGTGNQKEYGLGGGFDFGGFRVVAAYGEADPIGANNKVKSFSVGAGIKVGVGEILVQGIQIQRDIASGTKPKGTALGLAYVHPLSKRTNLYATIGQTRNNSAGNFVLRGSGAPVGAPGAVGDDPKGLALGIRHTF
ncbi:MAG: porin [Burkholderiaceae bacterium]